MTSIMKKRIGYLCILLLLCFVPILFTNYYISIVTEILILGIFALSLNILVGYTGLVSLGHAAFFGVGAYTSSLVAIHVSDNVFVTLAAGIVLSLLAALVIGYFCNKVSGFYFLMLTLAFSQMIYALVYRWGSFTGGDNGLSGVPKPSLWGDMLLDRRLGLYFFILIVFVLVFMGLRLIVRSPLGQLFIGIRENETRMKAMGYNTAWYKNMSFMIAGGLGGAAGSLYSYFNGFVSPKDIYWTMSGEVLIMVLIGGAGTLLGPVLGAGFIVILETVVSAYTDMWMLIVGITFVLFVIFVPKGIAGIGPSWKELRFLKLNARKNGVFQDDKRG